MSKLSYFEQLKHPNWQRKRLEMLESANWECTNCGSKETTLHVHHKQYIKGRMAWEYEPHELQVLCENCHQYEHQIGDEMKELLAQIDNGQALGLLRGFHLSSDWFHFTIGDTGRDADPAAYMAGFVAFLAYYMRPEQRYKLRDFIWSILDEQSEERLILEGNAHVFVEM